MKKPVKLVKFQPYANGRRPFQGRSFDFEVDGLRYFVMGVRDPMGGCVRPAGYPDENDDLIVEALECHVRGWT